MDVFVWVNTSTVLYQAYEDWAFDQTLRGLKPVAGGFVADEVSWLFGGRNTLDAKVEAPEPAAAAPNQSRLSGRRCLKCCWDA